MFSARLNSPRISSSQWISNMPSRSTWGSGEGQREAECATDASHGDDNMCHKDTLVYALVYCSFNNALYSIINITE